jgi:hypothetical protein
VSASCRGLLPWVTWLLDSIASGTLRDDCFSGAGRMLRMVRPGHLGRSQLHHGGQPPDSTEGRPPLLTRAGGWYRDCDRRAPSRCISATVHQRGCRQGEVHEVEAALPLFRDRIERVNAKGSGELEVLFDSGQRIEVPVNGKTRIGKSPSPTAVSGWVRLDVD